MISFARFFSVAAGLAALVLLFSPAEAFAETPQERVHRDAHHVMPFDMSKTVHVFKMTESGGVQRVVARHAEATDQIAMIREHLRHEAERFRRGDYSDPAKLHGADMPGLAELEANPSAVEVSYSRHPSGGEIRFQTDDLRVLTAIHRWFGAQLSEHGADARAE